MVLAHLGGVPEVLSVVVPLVVIVVMLRLGAKRREAGEVETPDDDVSSGSSPTS